MALQIPGYRIIRKIAQGGMSTVYLAIQISVGRIVALKVMSSSLNTDPSFSERFQREATIVGQLSHPNIVAIYDIGRQEDLNYIAMDYLPGGSVHDKMIKGLTSEEALRVTKEIASALGHAHEKGYIHRDIKPENILFRADGSAVLSDFGVAKGGIGVSRQTNVGAVVGTPQYMSPEQTRGHTVDERSDLYSLGVVFFEMLTGKLPYQGDDAVAIALKHISAPIPKLPLQFQVYQKILDRFLAKDPALRFQSGLEVYFAIEQLESTTRSPYAASTATVPDDLSIMALIRALIAATINALYWRAQRVMNLRWSKDQGFYQKPEDPIKRHSSPSIFGTRISQHTHINPLLFAHNKNKLKVAAAAVLSIIFWCAFSLVAQLQFPKQVNTWPSLLKKATYATASVFAPSLKQQAPRKSMPVAAPVHSQDPLPTSSQLTNTAAIRAAASAKSAVSASATSNPINASSQSSVPSAAASSASSLAPVAYALSIKVSPNDAKVKILNTPTKYKDGVELTAGKYQIEISKVGFVTKTEWIEIKNTPLTAVFSLEPQPPEPVNIANNTIPVAVFGGKNAPELIRIPAGSFMMGDNNNNDTAPAHKVTIAKPFAIGKYEVTFAEYDMFAQAMNKPLPGDNGWGRENRPIIHVSWDDAKAYTEWLSKTTGKKFRLPTEAEWEYVARAGSTGLYWWGNNEADAKGRANCRRGCLSNHSGLFGSKTAPIGSYLANPFGIYDTAGNVSEWTLDCYAENYTNAYSTAAAHEEKFCQGRVVRGGSTKDNVQRLASSARDNIPQGFMSETLGFRVVMEL